MSGQDSLPSNQCGECAKLHAQIERLDDDLSEVMDERDRATEALAQTHIALGGDGEWTGKLPPEPTPHSGDLHDDVPALAEELRAEVERLYARDAAHLDEMSALSCQLRDANAELSRLRAVIVDAYQFATEQHISPFARLSGAIEALKPHAFAIADGDGPADVAPAERKP